MMIFKKIAGLFRARKIIKNMVKEARNMDDMKPGKITTEFWGKNIVQLVVIANMFLKKDIDPNTALIIVGALEGIYTGARALVKAVRELLIAWKDKPQAAPTQNTTVITPPAA